MNYYVTYLDQKYLQHAEKLFELLSKYSKYKILAYTIDFHYSSKFDNVIPIYFENKNNTYIDNMFLKPILCKDLILKNTIDNFCYLDADILPFPNCDEIFELEKDNEYPLFARQCHDYIFFNNMNIDNNYEKNLFDYLNLNYSKRMDFYRQGCIFLFNYKCNNIIIEWANLCNDKYLKKEYLNYCPAYDENIINVLLWDKNHNHHLGRIHIDLPNFNNKNIFDFFYNLSDLKDDEHLFDLFTRIPKKNDFGKIKFLHGKLNSLQYEVYKLYLQLNFN